MLVSKSKGQPFYLWNTHDKVSSTARIVICCGTIPSAHIAITSALLFSETVTPLMCSVPCLMWPQHVNARTLHQSPSATTHSTATGNGTEWEEEPHRSSPKFTHKNILSWLSVIHSWQTIFLIKSVVKHSDFSFHANIWFFLYSFLQCWWRPFVT